MDLFINFINIIIVLSFVLLPVLSEAALNGCSVCMIHEVQKGWYDCSGCKLETIPQFPSSATKIDLSMNNLSAITNSSFVMSQNITELNLDSNIISYVDKGAFSELPFLKVLRMSNNQVTTECLLSLQQVEHLEELDISENLYFEYPDSLPNLRKLKVLTIDLFFGFNFDARFRYFNKLSYVVFNARGKFYVGNESFEGLQNAPIRKLILDFARFILKPIGINFLIPFRYLDTLQCPFNGRYDLKDFFHLLFGLRNRTLDSLILKGDTRDIDRYHRLSSKDIENLLTICVKNINFDHTNILHFPFESALDTSFSRCLEELSMANNYISWTFPSALALSYFPSIRHIDVSVPPTENPIRVSNIDMQGKNFHNRNITITVHCPKSLESITFSGNQFSQDIIGEDSFPGNYTIRLDCPNLTAMNASNTGLVICMFSAEFNTRITSFDMSGWKCKKLNSRYLWQLKHLKYLYAANSGLDRGLSDVTAHDFLSGLSKLEVVDLKGNDLGFLNDNLFRDQKYSLKKLYLQNNRLYRVPKAIRTLSCIDYVDLSSNNFAWLNKEDRVIIEEKVNTVFNFGGNKFDCSCNFRDSITWMSQRKSFFSDSHCIDRANISDILENIRSYELKCLSEFWLNFSVVTLLLLLLTILVVAAGYRNKAIVIYFFLKARRFIKRQRIDTIRSYNHDIFISYSQRDVDWVTETLCPYLTTSLGLRVCIHHKDFIPGKPIAEEILRCIDESRKSAFVITENFLQSEWSLFEMEIARRHVFQHESDTLIIILKDPLPVHKMPNVLKKIWWRVVCLKYPDNDDEEQHKLFWSKLKAALNQTDQ